MPSGYSIEFKNISKIYPGCIALDDVSFSIKSGEVHALIGENGAGKSTILNILHGVTKPEKGEILIDGRAANFSNAYDAICKGVSKVHQEINLVPDMTIAQNLLLGQEPLKGGLTDIKKMNAKAKELMNKVGLDLDPDRLVDGLSTGQMQLLQIAKVLSTDAKLISFDEPTASLSMEETKILFDIIRKLKEQGVTILYVSHRMDEIFKVTDRCTILRDGKFVDTVVTAEVNKEELIKKMVGRDVAIFAQRYNPCQADYSTKVLEVKNLTSKGVFENISFDLYKGEILGFYGLVGAKRTEVMRVLFGADKYSSGEVLINGKPVNIKSPTEAIKNRIGLLSENRKTEGFVYEFTNADNIALANINMFTKIFVNKNKIIENCRQVGGSINLKPSDPEFKTINLSGGNQQKVVLGKWLTADVDIMIFDEPTKGIDVGAKAEIYNLMEQLVAQGKSIIVVSSEQPEAIGMSDRMIIMHDGKIVAELKKEEFDENRILTSALGGN